MKCMVTCCITGLQGIHLQGQAVKALLSVPTSETFYPVKQWHISVILATPMSPDQLHMFTSAHQDTMATYTYFILRHNGNHLTTWQYSTKRNEQLLNVVNKAN